MVNTAGSRRSTLRRTSEEGEEEEEEEEESSPVSPPFRSSPSPSLSPSETKGGDIATTTTSSSSPSSSASLPPVLPPYLRIAPPKRKRGRPSKASLELEHHFQTLQNQYQQQLQKQQQQQQQPQRPQQHQSVSRQRSREDEETEIDILGLDGSEDAHQHHSRSSPDLTLDVTTIAPTILAQAIEYYRSIGITTEEMILTSYKQQPVPLSQRAIENPVVIESYRLSRSNTQQTQTPSYLSPLTLTPSAPPCLGQYFPGLSYYDLERKPLPVVHNHTEQELPQRALNQELTCPVCLGILRNTMTVMECLHRFCDDCISKSLRLGKKECPTCRVKCSSRRSLRPDVNLDALIARIYPDLDSYEADEDSYIEQVNKTLPKPSFLSPDSSNQQKKRLRSTSSTTSTPTISLNFQPTLTSTSSTSSTSSKSSKNFRKDSEQYITTQQHSRKLKHSQRSDSVLEERDHHSSSSSSASARKSRRLSTEEDGDNLDNIPRQHRHHRFEMNEDEDDEYGLVLSPRSNSPSFSPPLEPGMPNSFQEDNNKGHHRSGRGSSSSRVVVDLEGDEDEEMTFQKGEEGNRLRHLQHHHNRLAETESDNSAVYYYPHIPARSLSVPAAPLPPSSTTPSFTTSLTPPYPQSSQPSLALAHIHMSSAVAPLPTNPDYISFMLVPHPRAKSLRPLHTPHFHAPKKTTVAALLKYIAQSYNVREAGIFRLYTELVATSFLSSHVTLEEIHLTQEKTSRDNNLVFFYGLFTNAL